MKACSRSTTPWQSACCARCRVGENFPFFGSNAGGEHVAIVYSIAETTKLDSRSLEIHIATALDRLAKGYLAGEISGLLP